MDRIFAFALLTLLVLEPWLGIRFYRRFRRAGPGERPRLYLEGMAFGVGGAVLALAYALSSGHLGEVLPFSGAPRLGAIGLSGLEPLLPGILAGGFAGSVLALIAAAVPKVSSRLFGKAGEFAAFFPRNGRERLLCVGIAVSAAVGEELAFRGALLHVLQRALPAHGLALAAGVAIAIFGLAHLYQGARGVLATTLAGAALMAVFLGTGSLLPGIALHFAIDLKLALVRLPALSPEAATA